ncbi:MAG: hypothetical protein NC489_25360 [Ruminococcus flavefaciens]|nr:hypothetical protein [Ruminococcus flavefaciens]
MLIDEYRIWLFSDVVTGQIDVRDIEIPNFEYVEELGDSFDGNGGVDKDMNDASEYEEV